MRAVNVPSSSYFKRVCSGLLAIWLSGVVFLLCCSSIKGQATVVESCPLAKLGHSCAKSAANDEALRIEAPGSDCSNIDCCSFLPQLFQKVRKSENTREIAELPAKLEIKVAYARFVRSKQSTSRVYRSRLVDRQDVYLINRVFRI